MVRIDKIYLHQPSAMAGIHQARKTPGRHPVGMASPMGEYGPKLGRYRVDDAADGFQRTASKDAVPEEAMGASWPVRPWEAPSLQPHLAETHLFSRGQQPVFLPWAEPAQPGWASSDPLSSRPKGHEQEGACRSEPSPGPLGEVFWGAFVLLPMALSYGISLLHPGMAAQYYLDVLMIIYMALAGLWVWQVSEWSHLLWQCLSRAVVLVVLLMLMGLAPAFDLSGAKPGWVLPTPARIEAHFKTQAHTHPLGQLRAHVNAWQGGFSNRRLASDIQHWAFNALCFGLSLTCLTGAFQRRSPSKLHQNQRQ